MTFVICLSLWILQATHDQITDLAYISCDLKKTTSLAWNLDLVRLMVFLEFSAGYFHLPSNGVFATISAVTFVWKFFLQQAEFARLDRASKTNRSKSYIYSAGPSQSGWANNPNFLKHVPRFITSRHLTCMTLVEIVFLLYAAYKQPEDGAFFIACTMLCHYITDAMDGALGRYRKEGYLLWGYATDHVFDALYESACAIALWMMVNDQDPSRTHDLLGPITLLMMNLFVFGFHSKETISFRKKLATHYSNMAGPYPLHYIEWSCVAYLLVIHFTGLSIIWNVYLMNVFLFCGITANGIWHLKARKLPINGDNK
jgi:phosphatidylglycerophosphate synthase